MPFAVVSILIFSGCRIRNLQLLTSHHSLLPLLFFERVKLLVCTLSLTTDTLRLEGSKEVSLQDDNIADGDAHLEYHRRRC